MEMDFIQARQENYFPRSCEANLILIMVTLIIVGKIWGGSFVPHDISQVPQPISYYGATKLYQELVLRTVSKKRDWKIFNH